jgi:uncharacterized membrane protein YgcG
MLTRLRAALLLATLPIHAADWSAIKSQGYVNDFAGIIDAAAGSQLESYGGALEQATHVRLFLVTLPTLQNEPVADVAAALYRAWHPYGKSGDAVLLLLAVAEGRVYLHGPNLPEGLSASVLREMSPALREWHYGEAFKAAADTIGRAVAESHHVHFSAPLPRSANNGVHIPWLVVTGVVLLTVVALRYRLLHPAASSARASWGGRGSGGFGGYDSADTFGGFGGADAGRHGSSDW